MAGLYSVGFSLFNFPTTWYSVSGFSVASVKSEYVLVFPKVAIKAPIAIAIITIAIMCVFLMIIFDLTALPVF